MSTLQTSIAEFVQDQLSTDGRDSKKYLAMMFGMISVLSLALCAGLLFIYAAPTVAPYVAQVAQIAATAIGGLVSVYIGGQAVVEWRANGVLKTSVEQPTEPIYAARPAEPFVPPTNHTAAPKPFGGTAVET